MAEEMYYYCGTCKKPVSARQMYCDGCRKRFGHGAQKYTMAQIEELQRPVEAVKEEKKEEAMPKAVAKVVPEVGACLQCPICQKSYDVNHTVCDDCGMPLIMIYEPVVVPEECVTESGLIFGAEIGEPIWALNVKRFVDNLEDGVRTIVINHSIMPMGRRYLVENNVFSNDMMAVAQSLKKVSTDNAFFIVEGDALYIQYDTTKVHDKNGAKKAAIKINGEMLLPNTRKRLTIHDRITFGYVQQSNKEGCVQFDVIPYGDNTLGKEAAIEMQKMLGVIAKDVKEAKANQEVLKQQSNTILEKEDRILEKIYEISDLKVTNYQKDEFDRYIRVLEAYERQNRGETLSEEEYIRRFFNGHERTEEFMAMLTERQRYFLYSAAFYEEKAQIHSNEGLDYSASAICLGKVLELFANDILMRLLKSFKESDWEKLALKQKAESAHELGTILGHFTQSGENGEICGNKKLTKRMVQAYQEKYSDCAFKELIVKMEQAFADCDKGRVHRNFAAHMNEVSPEKYMEMKNHFINTEYMLRIFEFCNEIA